MHYMTDYDYSDVSSFSFSGLERLLLFEVLELELLGGSFRFFATPVAYSNCPLCRPACFCLRSGLLMTDKEGLSAKVSKSTSKIDVEYI